MERIAELLASEDEWRGRLRAAGGLLVGTGLLLIFLRRLYTIDPWGDLALLLVLAGAFVFLYGAGMLAALTAPDRHPWQGAMLVFGTVVLPLALLQLVSFLDGDTGAALNIAWIFLATALAGAAAAWAGARYGLFLMAAALIVSWLALWDELLDDGIFGEIGALRALLVVIGVALLAAGAAARLFAGPAGRARGGELLTGGSLAAVAAGAISFDAYLATSPVIGGIGAGPNDFWNAYLLVASVAAILLAIALPARGVAYVGALGLAIFILVIGFDLTAATPEGDLVGWPLLALALGLAAFLASLIRVVEVPEEGEGEEAPERGEGPPVAEQAAPQGGEQPPPRPRGGEQPPGGREGGQD